MVAPPHQRQGKANDPLDASLDAVKAALEKLRYGQVALTVHEGKVVQIEVTEKQRFTRN